MSKSARERIMNRLRSAGSGTTAAQATPAALPAMDLNPDEKIQRLTTLMEALRTEVHLATKEDWTARLAEIATAKGLGTLAYGPDAPIGRALADAWQDHGDTPPALVPYDEPAESFKATLFETDASITSTMGAIAETGALILWPTPEEPRQLSLVPDVHIAVLDSARIYNTFAEAMTALDWAQRIPTNALLISGPSKTADIEFILTFGVHGPKELILLVLE